MPVKKICARDRFDNGNDERYNAEHQRIISETCNLFVVTIHLSSLMARKPTTAAVTTPAIIAPTPMSTGWPIASAL